MQLVEIVRNIADMISTPTDYEEELEWLSSPENRKFLFKRFPHCCLPFYPGVEGEGMEPFLFPICNRKGLFDPKIISFSIKLAKRMYDTHQDERYLAVYKRLVNLLSRYKPGKMMSASPTMAARKARATRLLKRVTAVP